MIKWIAAMFLSLLKAGLVCPGRLVPCVPTANEILSQLVVPLLQVVKPVFNGASEIVESCSEFVIWCFGGIVLNWEAVQGLGLV